MRVLKFLFRSNLFISLGAVAFLLGASWLMQLPLLPWEYYLLVGSATFWIYNLNVFLLHLAGERHKGNSRVRWQRLHSGPMLSLLVSSLLAAVYTSFILHWAEVLWLLQLGLISVLYTLPYFKAQPKPWQLRSIPLLKIFLIAYVWTGMSVGLTAIHFQLPLAQAMLPFVGAFAFILAITLPFDIRDYKADQAFRLLTLPGSIGIRATKGLGLVLLTLFALLYFFQLTNPLYLLLCVLPSAWLILKAHPDRKWWYFTALLDGCLLLYALSLFLAQL